jgi:ABC-type oligopeptide transport system ATPase subunit
MQSLVEVKNLSVRYGAFEAVKGVTFTVGEGEIFGIVGESGSGKSTIAKRLLGWRRKAAAKSPSTQGRCR